MVTIEAPTSFLALSQLLFNLVADSPLRANAPTPTASYSQRTRPRRMMVGENEGTVTMKLSKGYVIIRQMVR